MDFHDEALFHYAMKFVGLPYQWGGDDPIKGFDCSGFVIELLKSSSLIPEHYDNTAQGLFDDFEKRPGTTYSSICAFGALVFYGESLSKITHVGFGLDRFRILSASGGDHSTISAAQASTQNAYIKMRGIDYRKDRTVILIPNYRSIGII